jgi:outer membrane protein assembly complex protein YaeT
LGTRIALSLLALALSAPAGAVGVRAPTAARAAPGEGSRPAEVAAAEPTPAELTPAPALPSPRAPPVVRSVELHLTPGTDVGTLARDVTIRPGAPVSRRAVRRTLERLFASGRFSDIAIFEQSAGEGQVDVIIDARTRTFVDRVEFDGHRVLTLAALQAAANVPERRVEVYPEFVDQVVERLRTAYRRKGYEGVAVTHAVLTDEKGETALAFEIKEGEPTRIASISVAGDPQLPVPELLKTLDVSPGQVLDLDRLERGVEALKARFRTERHWRAKLGAPEVATLGTGATIRLPVSAGPRVELRFKGNRSFDERTLLKVLAYDGEEPLDVALLPQLEEKIAAFYRAMGFADVAVRTRDVRLADRRGSYLVFGVEEGEPLRVVQVRFEGNRHFDEAFLRERVSEALLEAMPALEGADPVAADALLADGPAPRRSAHYVASPGTVFSEGAYQSAIGRILALYRADGFLEAKAEPPILDRDERRRQARVAIRLDEGPQTRIAAVDVIGAPDLPAARRALGLRAGRPLNSLDVETSRLAIQRLLGQSGYLYAKVVDEEQLSGDHTRALVLFRVQAGPKVRVGRILVDGLNRTAEDVVRSALSVQEGGILDPELLAQSQRNLTRLGIFKVASLRLNAPDVPEEVKDLYVSVEERATQSYGVGGGYSLIDGPRAFVEYSKINLFGRALQLQARAKVSYFNLSYPVLTDPAKYVGSSGGSCSSASCSSSSALDALGRRINVALIYPRILALLPTEIGTRLDLIHERINRPSYGFQRTGGILGFDWVAPRIFSAALQYDIERDDIARYPGATNAVLSFSDRQRLLFQEGGIFLHSVRLSVGIDLRDDSANPHRGLFVGGSAQAAQCLGGQVTSTDGGQSKTETPFCLFLKAVAQANFYLPLPRGIVLAVQAKVGRIFPLDGKSQTPPPLRFFLGGATSMRGWLEDALVPADVRRGILSEVEHCRAALNPIGCTQQAQDALAGKTTPSPGGELFTLGRAELRVPITGALETALFFDAGNLWFDPGQFRWQLRTAAGIGLRVVTPIGPAALDLAVNLGPDLTVNESRFVPQFSIGVF